MTYRGEVRNGVVVFRDAPPLEDGTVVQIEAVSGPGGRPVPGSREAMLQCDARWVSEPEEWKHSLADLQRARDEDLTPAGDSE